LFHSPTVHYSLPQTAFVGESNGPRGNGTKTKNGCWGDYGWCCCDSVNADLLNRLQRRAAIKLITKCNNSNVALSTLSRDTLRDRREKRFFKFVKKCRKGAVTQFLNIIFNRDLVARTKRQGTNLHLPRVRNEPGRQKNVLL
jgi:hypothetical protein